MSESEQYDENNLEHQDPIHPVSEWQRDNDCDGALTTMWDAYDQKHDMEYQLKNIGLPTAEQLELWVDLYWAAPNKIMDIESKLTGAFAQRLRSVADVIEKRLLNEEKE